MSLIPIVFSTDHNFVMPTGVAIYSLLSTSVKEDYDIFVLIDDSVTEQDRSLLKKQVSILSDDSRISFIKVEQSEIGEVYETRGITRPTYFKLLIPWLLPEYDKVFYADGDMIFKKGLRELYENFDLNGNYIAGVHHEEYPELKNFKEKITKLGLDPHKYINAGFLLINSAKIRDEISKTDILKLCEKNYESQDQDIINILFSGHTLSLDKSYNCKSWLVSPVDKCNIIHYVGLKPWNSFSGCWIDWWEIYRKSIFYDRKLENSVIKEIMHVHGSINSEHVRNTSLYIEINKALLKRFPSLNKLAERIYGTYKLIKR